MNNQSPFQARWSWRPLLACNLVALALLCFWLWPIGQGLCRLVDERLFHTLNSPLADNAAWRVIWAVSSMRPFDILVGLILLTLMIKGDWVFRAVQVRQALLGFIATLVLMVVVRALFSKWISFMGLDHDSPSMVLPDAVHLSDYYPNVEKRWELKDRSSQSFPGDHASVLLIWALFMHVFSRRAGQRVVIWLAAFLFMMPRLVAGAHWGQDDYIGGLLLALVALGWGVYTPFAAHASRLLLKASAPLFRIAQRLPLINRMSIVRAA